MLGAFYKSEQFINCAAHFINPYTLHGLGLGPGLGLGEG